MSLLESVLEALGAIRSQAPLVHNITNYVVMNTTANALLALGASPAMVHAPEEVEEFVSISSSLVVNPGTLSGAWVQAMHLACSRARARSLPWVLDPVGVGATVFRTQTSRALLGHRPSVIRGNASEILALAGTDSGTTKGVDSTQGVESAVEAARRLAASGAVVAISGPVDVVTDGERWVRIANGDPLMPRVTGLGCTATALTGAFLAVGASPLVSASGALLVLGVAGERAAARSAGPGTLQLHILDELYAMQPELLRTHARLSLS